MVHVAAHVELPVAPSRAREIFLDFPSWPQWTSKGPIRSVTPLPANDNSAKSSPSSSDPPAPKGSKVRVDFGYGVTMTSTVVENNAEEFRWRSQWPVGLMSAEHSFKFQPSKITPGGTTFVNEEVFDGSLTSLVSKLTPGMGSKKGEPQTSPGFEGFNECFRQRVESLTRH